MPAKNPTACLLVIGNEVLSGRTQDANIRFLATHLGELGIPLREVRVIPDVPETIIGTVNEVRAKFDYVFTTGGIGPTHDDITSECIAAAFGVPCELSSEDVMAVIVVRPGASARPDEICAFLESRLARFAIPRYLELSDALPLTDTGKVNRSKLKERGLTAATWDREAVGGEPHVHR